MPTNHRDKLASIKRFDQLIAYLRDEMDWPIARDSFEDVDELFYEFTADELGIDPKTAVKIQEIKRLKRLAANQPWGIFFVKFEPKKLPVVALRRILSQVALKKRASANNAERAAWSADDLLFVSNYGEGDERQISFAHFSRAQGRDDLPTLKVLGWNNLDTALHLDSVARELTEHLGWPDDDADADAWRTRWRAAFTLRHREVVRTSKELSIRLAELARDIRDRITSALAIETDKGPLTKLMKAFQEALVHDLDADGFADMYAQTIAYGLLSARIADPHKKTADDFAGHMRTNPFLRDLMETFLRVGGRRGKAGGPGIDFDELGVSEIVDLLDDPNTHMEAVVRDFGDRNPQEDPVIHFYELFLKEYDAGKRMQRGVFYTPRPVVSYIVRSADELLRTEFGLEDGLASTTTWGEMAKRHQDLKIPEGVPPDQDFVQILDPATGTGTFLVEVIDVVHATLVAKWTAEGHGEKKINALWNEYVPKHLLTRLHGYELLMAPYAIAHLKIGLKLYETGYRFASDERARIYLTNALEPSKEFSDTFAFAIPALAQEANAVNEVKRQRRFVVVIGNPPYAGHSVNNQVEWIVDKVYDYKRGLADLNKPGQAKWLQDDYVKFIRFAEHVLSESSVGVLAFITNHSYLTNPTFRGMRRHLRESFQRIDVVDLHGSLKKEEDRNETADGEERDENVFDIQQGVAIVHATRFDELAPRFGHRELWGSRKQKNRRLASAKLADPTAAEPKDPLWLFVPRNEDLLPEYEQGCRVQDVFSVAGDPAPGIVTTHDEFAIAFTEREIVRNVELLLTTRTETEARNHFRLCSQSQWSYQNAKRELAGGEWKKKLLPILYRPFDIRQTIDDSNVAVHRRERALRHMTRTKNIALLTDRQVTAGFRHVFCSRVMANDCALSTASKERTYVLPLYVVREEGTLGVEPEVRPNLGRTFLKQLAASLGVPISGQFGLPEGTSPEQVFGFIYSVLHSPNYRSRYREFLKSEFPRIPFPGSPEVFHALARLGNTLVSTHLLEDPIAKKGNTGSPNVVGDIRVEVEKVDYSGQTVWIDKKKTVGFRGIGEEVWSFQIGGYQVCEKWLKDRKGRRLTKDEISQYQRIVIALFETIGLMKNIDEVIDQHGGWPEAFQPGAAQAAATAKVVRFRPRIVKPKPAERYVACVPLVPLRAAAGAFGDPQRIDDDGVDWVAVDSNRKLRRGMFVAQVVGKSMEPRIPDGSWCLFRAPVDGTRHGKIVLVQLRDEADPETGERYTVKRYESEKATKGDSWRHERITLKPVNPDFEPIVLTDREEGELKVVAEFLEVLSSG
jgi:SOS-response transcriptional repressor LexA